MAMQQRYQVMSLVLALSCVRAAIAAGDPAPPRVPEGYTISVAAAPPLVRHPVMAGFDDRGRLFVAEPDGNNLRRDELEKQLPGEVRRLEDTDGDGVFDKSVVFVDKLTFPQGALWHDGALYVCASGALWKFIDKDDDGKADERIKLVGDFGYTGNAADVHGPFLGPDGRIWWCEGRHGHEIKDGAGRVISKGKAARIFNCKTDGSDVRTWCTGGMDNPVEIVFTPDGDVIGTVNLFYSRPRGDCLVHWVYGGVYPREDFVDQLSSEFIRTGPLLPEVHNFGHVAVSGLCLYRSEHFGSNPAFGASAKPSDPLRLFVTQFNMHKVVRVELERSGSTYRTAKIEDFLTTDDPDFHPTDVLEAPDGSLLVINTGGWFRIGCPVSQVAKPDIEGRIYRIRRSDGPRVGGAQSPVVHRVDVQPFAQAIKSDKLWQRRAGAEAMARVATSNDVAPILAALGDATNSGDRLIQHALIYGLIRTGDRASVATALRNEDAAVRDAAKIALEQMTARPTATTSIDLPPPATPVALNKEQVEALLATEKSLPGGDAQRGRAIFQSAKTACATCHGVQNEGGKLGPALTRVGTSRTARDLLESILHPSASFARGYEPHIIETDDGSQLIGIVVGDKDGTIELATGAGKVVSIKTSTIKSVQASTISIMPQGIDKALSKQELADLLAYLTSLK